MESHQQRVNRIHEGLTSGDRAKAADALEEAFAWQQDSILRLGAALGLDLNPAPPPPPKPSHLRVIK